MCGGGGEVKGVSVETRGQPDAGWLAATETIFGSKKLCFHTYTVFHILIAILNI